MNSVVFNGVDVTGELDENCVYETPVLESDSELSISYDVSTDINSNSIATEAVKAYGYNGELVVTGVSEGAEVSVYDTNGILLRRLSSKGNDVRIALPEEEIYIVKTDEKAIKVAL